MSNILRNKIREIISELEIEKNKISYSAVVLDENSRNKLISFTKTFIPQDFEIIAHHMTICLGELPNDLKSQINQKVELVAYEIGFSEKAIAVKVSGFYSKNEISHITLAVNRLAGGKPFDSNKIKDWVELEKNIELSGFVQEIPFENKKIISENLTISDIKQLPFKDDIKNIGGKIFSVGGRVRDEFLGKDSKDLDILITGVDFDKLEKILSKYGKVDLVGKSFGIIKFKPEGSQEDIDIALPRTERSLGTGHKDFEVTVDTNMPIEKELTRRDFTINSIAKSIDGEIIDPFGGLEDLKNKIIRATSPKAFSEDPLRMIRAVQFAARFGFTIEPNTFNMIKENARDIQEISKERILIEFDKILKKGKPELGIELLDKSNLFENIFGFKFKGNYDKFKNINKMSDFIFLCFENQQDNPSEFFKKYLKGDIQTTKELESLQLINLLTNDKKKDRAIVMKMIHINPKINESNVISPYLKDIINELITGKYPKSISELEVDGNELMSMGLRGKEIGNALSDIIINIYQDNLKNNKGDIINFLNQNNKNNEMINESENNNENIDTLYFFDFDGTLADSPTPEKGKIKYQEITGNPYPHQGWWGRAESLDTFDVKLHDKIIDFYNKSKQNPNAKVFLLTNRVPKVKDSVMNILNKNKLKFDSYSFKSGGDSKIERIKKFLNEFPNTKEIFIFDDQDDQLIPFNMFKEDMTSNTNIKVNVIDARNYH
jgi:tRNA nucleotidyltransferase (CCA-adding enzyme)